MTTGFNLCNYSISERITAGNSPDSDAITQYIMGKSEEGQKRTEEADVRRNSGPQRESVVKPECFIFALLVVLYCLGTYSRNDFCSGRAYCLDLCG